ncbi:ARM repeat-containing protein [Cristinia sonorae]|uniref:ARM repeat-containing protein n=1 Tax=Cristinia sonorae TaxID=1940300 RepID=A0A8K0UWB5_9AGAR|nr:ARM repeat-containing protein [Cristinia sonorae]
MADPNKNRQVDVPADELFQVICDAASQDPLKIKTSTDRLKQMLDMTGCFDALSQISAQRVMPLQVRQQSIIQLKNAVINQWRSRRLVLPEQRQGIKERCLSLMNEPDDLISKCNQVVIAKIARQDFPLNWQNLLPDLLSIIETNMTARYTGGSSDFLALRRTLEILHCVTKEFASMKLMFAVKNMAKIVDETHLKLYAYYTVIASSLEALDPTTVSDRRMAEEVLLAHLVFKSLTKCASWLYQKAKGRDQENVDQWLHNLFRSTVDQLRRLVEKRANIVIALQTASSAWDPIATQTITYLTRHIFGFGKFYRRLLQLDAARFVTLPLSTDLVLYYWNKVVQATQSPSGYIADSPTAVYPVRFVVQCMAVFKGSVAQWSPTRVEGSALDQAFVEEAVRILVTRFIPLNPSDLEEWMSDPEEWVNVEERGDEQWEYEIRPCGERVLMTLSSQYRDYVDPLLKATWEEARSLQSSELSVILQKEAVYCALGRCANRLGQLIPFDEWLRDNLAREARGTDSTYPILKRRIAWLIGKWVSSESTTPNNPLIWELLAFLLQDQGPGTDAVVRLTAAVAIRECVDTTDFDINVLRPYLHPIVRHLVALISEADTLESKRRISNTLNAVIERAETDIIPLMGIIAEPIPQLWVSAGVDWVFKGVLLETVTKLVGASKENSMSLVGLVVPMVKDSFTPAAIQQLDADGLNLWLISVQNATTIEAVNGAPGLVELFPLIIHLLSNNLDLLGRIISIAESYFLLDAPRLLQAYGNDIFAAFMQSMKQALSVNVLGLLSALNLLLQVAGSFPVWGEAMHTSGLFSHIIKSLSEEKMMATLLSGYVLVLARIAIADNRLFVQLMSLTGPVLNMPESQVWEDTLNQWWARFDNIYEPRQRKLVAMGISRLVATGRPEVLERLHTEVCNIWTDVFGELREAMERANEEGPESLTLYWDRQPDELFDDCKGTLEFGRRTTAYESDIVRTTQLTTYVRAAIQEAEMICGPAVFYEKYLSKIDPAVMKQIQKELTP